MGRMILVTVEIGARLEHHYSAYVPGVIGKLDVRAHVNTEQTGHLAPHGCDGGHDCLSIAVARVFIGGAKTPAHDMNDLRHGVTFS